MQSIHLPQIFWRRRGFSPSDQMHIQKQSHQLTNRIISSRPKPEPQTEAKAQGRDNEVESKVVRASASGLTFTLKRWGRSSDLIEGELLTLFQHLGNVDGYKPHQDPK
eukprot:231319-Amorphochlora_amoeboformis.AAC.1